MRAKTLRILILALTILWMAPLVHEALGYTPVPATFGAWEPGMTQYTAEAERPGDFMKFLLPPGTVFARILLFKPQRPVMPAAVRVNCPPQCKYTLSMSAEDYIALPFPDPSAIPLSEFERRDVQVRGTSGIVTVLDRPVSPALTAPAWVFVRALAYDSSAYVYRASLMVEVETAVYRAWYDAGRPLPSVGCGNTGPCDPAWSRSSEDPAPPAPEPDGSCDPFTAAICRLRGMDCKDGACVPKDPGPGQDPKVGIELAAEAEPELVRLDPGDGPAVRIEELTLLGLPASEDAPVVAAYARGGRIFIASAQPDGSVAFERFCPGDPLAFFDHAGTEAGAWSTDVFRALGEIPVEKAEEMTFICGVLTPRGWRWVLFGFSREKPGVGK